MKGTHSVEIITPCSVVTSGRAAHQSKAERELYGVMKPDRGAPSNLRLFKHKLTRRATRKFRFITSFVSVCSIPFWHAFFDCAMESRVLFPEAEARL